MLCLFDGMLPQLQLGLHLGGIVLHLGSIGLHHGGFGLNLLMIIP